MAPVKSNKPAEINPWGWITQVPPHKVQLIHILAAYRITGFQKCTEPRRNCKRNPYCLHGLGEKKWKEDSDGDDEQEAAFRIEGEYAGLQNLGATCYVNSLLQLWYHNPIFRPAIFKWTPSAAPVKGETYTPSCPLAQLQAIFARLKMSKRSKIDPTDFVSSLLLNTGEQQDAQEFAKLFMDYIVKLLTDYGNEQIRKLIDCSFNGQLEYETVCLGCKNSTKRSEGFTELNLNVKKHLSECLDDLLEDEIISDEYKCSNCHKKNTAKRRMHLLTLPPILNLQLMRFVFDRETLRRKKVTQNISFPEVLEMQSRISGINPVPDACDSKYKYHLTAVLIHNGQSASSGHYVAQIKDLRNGEWLKFNDEFVDPVHKGRNQKPKDQENGNEDNDKKSKPKKSKNSPSLTSSGAYMLVYTLDQYFQQPEPDPELHQYLIDLVQEEDQSFELEVNKNKNEKDFEQAVRNQRRREVEWLYDLRKEKKEETNGNGKSESDAENEEGPKPKQPRYDKEILMEKETLTLTPSNNENNKSSEVKVKGNSSDGETESQISTNGISTEVPLPTRKDHYDTDEVDFVSVDWISQWLDPGNPVPPVENGMLLCEHKRLSPPPPNSNPCLYRIVPAPVASVWYEHYQGGPRLRHQDLCDKCVQKQCRRLRSLAELDDDSKQVTELIKQFDTECSTFTKQGKEIPDSLQEDKKWVSKDSLKNWKKLAKQKLEEEEDNGVKKENDEEDNVPTTSTPESMDVDGDDGPFNGDLFCEHGNLSQDMGSRKMIPNAAWTIIAKYFEDPIVLDVKESMSCEECKNQEYENSVTLRQNKDMATYQKAGLSDLYANRNRPDVDKMGTFYIVSASFVAQWRRFIKEPSRNDVVTQLNNQTLMCKHDKFLYPIDFVSELISTDSDEMVCSVTPDEWKFIQANFECDQAIEATVAKANHKDSITYEPDICHECAEAWLTEELKKQYSYSESPIYVIKRDTGDTAASDEEEDIAPPKEQSVVLTGKRESKKTDPFAWMAGLSANAAIRRSHRPRGSKGEKMYKVASTLTIRELKQKICTDFKALLSDQHLYYNNKELVEPQKSLGEYAVPAKARLYLEIDTAENGTEEEPAPRTVETGFQGTLLIGGNAAFGDRSPVQN